MSAPFVPVPEVIVGVLALGTALQRSGRDSAREGIRTGELSCETGRCFQPTHPFFLRPRLPAPSGDVGSSLHSKLAPSSRARPPPPPARGSARLTAGEGRSQQHARGGPGPGSVQALAGARSLRSAAAMSADPVVFVAAVRTAIGEGPGDGCSSGAGCPQGRGCPVGAAWLGLRAVTAFPSLLARFLQRRPVRAARARVGRRRHPRGAAAGRAGPRGGVGGGAGPGANRR